MFNLPKTLEEARKLEYGVFFQKRRYSNKQCAYEIYPNERGPIPYQCKRKPGHGPENLYCSQHAKEVK